MFLSAHGPAMTEEDIAGTSFGGSFRFEGPSSELDDTLILNGVRSRKKVGELPCCPICSCTIRNGELQTHLSLEMDKLTKISCGKRKCAGTPNSSSSSSNGLNEDLDISGSTGSEVYERVRRNRSRRLRAARGRGVVQCPVCSVRLPASAAEAHVEACLAAPEESVDVENDAETGFGTVYSWCSEERVRAGALQLREGGALPSGAHRVRRASTDTDLVVDGDDDILLYGPPQYSPERIAPEENFFEGHASEETSQTPRDDEPDDGTSVALQLSNHSHHNSFDSQPIVLALKDRVRELESRLASRNNRAETKCLICMGPYSEPVVSIECWHVYCENCWLESLRAKKTCPQCNAITTASHLRRIYI